MHSDATCAATGALAAAVAAVAAVAAAPFVVGLRPATAVAVAVAVGGAAASNVKRPRRCVCAYASRLNASAMASRAW